MQNAGCIAVNGAPIEHANLVLSLKQTADGLYVLISVINMHTSYNATLLYLTNFLLNLVN